MTVMAIALIPAGRQAAITSRDRRSHCSDRVAWPSAFNRPIVRWIAAMNARSASADGNHFVQIFG